MLSSFGSWLSFLAAPVAPLGIVITQDRIENGYQKEAIIWCFMIFSRLRVQSIQKASREALLANVNRYVIVRSLFLPDFIVFGR